MRLVTESPDDQMAFGFLMEREKTQVQIATRLEYFTLCDANRDLAKTDKVGSMIAALQKSLNSK